MLLKIISVVYSVSFTEVAVTTKKLDCSSLCSTAGVKAYWKTTV